MALGTGKEVRFGNLTNDVLHVDRTATGGEGIARAYMIDPAFLSEEVKAYLAANNLTVVKKVVQEGYEGLVGAPLVTQSVEEIVRQC